jgi:hypothetical protein
MVFNVTHSRVILRYKENGAAVESNHSIVIIKAFRTSESESADFSEVRVRKYRTLKTLRTRTQRVC